MGSLVVETEVIPEGKANDIVQETEEEEEEEESEDDTVYLDQELPVREPPDNYYEDVLWFANTTVAEMRAIQDTLARQARKYPNNNRFFRVNKPAHIIKAAAAAKHKPLPTLPYKLWVKHPSSKTSAAGCTAACTWLPPPKPLSPHSLATEDNNITTSENCDVGRDTRNRAGENTNKPPAMFCAPPTATGCEDSQECTVPSMSPSTSPAMSEKDDKNTNKVTSKDESDSEHTPRTSPRLSSRRVAVPSIEKQQRNAPNAATKRERTNVQPSKEVERTTAPSTVITSAKPSAKPVGKLHKPKTKVQLKRTVKTHTRWSARKPAAAFTNCPGRNGRKHPTRGYGKAPTTPTGGPTTKNTDNKTNVSERSNKKKVGNHDFLTKQPAAPVAKKSHKKQPSHSFADTQPRESKHKRPDSPSTRELRANNRVKSESKTDAPPESHKTQSNVSNKERYEEGVKCDKSKTRKRTGKRETESSGEEERVSSTKEAKKSHKRRANGNGGKQENETCGVNGKRSCKAKGYHIVSESDESDGTVRDYTMSADSLLEMALRADNEEALSTLLEVLGGPRQKRSCRR